MLNILLVEDNLGDQNLFKHALEATGIECKLTVASNGHDGLKIIRQDKPDLMVLDLMMPGMSGYDVYSALKFDRSLKEILPIILLTGHKEAIDPRQGELKRVFYMEKPCEVDELKEMIHHIFKDRITYGGEN